MKHDLYKKGQGLAEIALISGLIAVASIVALSVMAPVLNNQLKTMWGYFGAS